jgi:hypothetical protein
LKVLNGYGRKRLRPDENFFFIKRLVHIYKLLDIIYHLLMKNIADLVKGNNMDAAPGSKRVLRGVYSVSDGYDLLSAYCLRYPQAIITLFTALEVYGVVDEFVAPPYSMAFCQGSRSVKDEKVRQLFISKSIFLLGMTEVDYGGYAIRIYDKERLLIEFFRFRNKVSLPEYKEAISFFRKEVEYGRFNVPRFKEYAKSFREASGLLKRFSMEVM